MRRGTRQQQVGAADMRQSSALQKQRAVQCSFQLLSKAQKEALMAILCSLGDEELTTLQNRAHGEVTLEWRVAHDHPILEILPEPMSFLPPPPVSVNRSGAKLQPQSTSEVQDRHVILREARSTGVTTSRGRNVSPAAAASRRGAAARNRSNSPRPSSSLRTSSVERQHAPHRTVQWAFRTIDEVFSATRKMRLDTTTTATVEELTQHILTNRYGVTTATKRMFGELCTAAQLFSIASPLCMVFSTYATKRSLQDLKEFVMLAKIVGALAPWSSRESVKTAVPPSTVSTHPALSDSGSQNHIVALRRYLSISDMPLALRDAIAVMIRKGSTLGSDIRRFVTLWVQRAVKSPPIAFDYHGNVDADVLALVLVEGLREARTNAERLQTEYGEFTLQHTNATSADGFDDDDAGVDTMPAGGAQHARSRYSDEHNHSLSPRRYMPPYQSEDFVDVIQQRRILHEANSDAEHQARSYPNKGSNSPMTHTECLHPSPSRHVLTPKAQGGLRDTQGGVVQGGHVVSRRTLTPRTAWAPPERAAHKSSKGSPLVVTLPQRNPNRLRDSGDDSGYLPIEPDHFDDRFNSGDEQRRGSPNSSDVMGALLARREEAILAALSEQLRGGQEAVRGYAVDDTTHRMGAAQAQPHLGGSSVAFAAETPINVTTSSPPPPNPSRTPLARRPDDSPLATSPYQTDLADMRSTLQAIEDELHRRQSDEGGRRGSSTHANRPREEHRSWMDHRQPLVSPPRDALHPLDALRIPPSTSATLLSSPSSQGLADDERLLLEQLEVSLKARKTQHPHSNITSVGGGLPPPAPRRPLEVVAEPL
jgi:hypothetical protein